MPSGGRLKKRQIHCSKKIIAFLLKMSSSNLINIYFEGIDAFEVSRKTLMTKPILQFIFTNKDL